MLSCIQWATTTATTTTNLDMHPIALYELWMHIPFSLESPLSYACNRTHSCCCGRCLYLAFRHKAQQYLSIVVAWKNLTHTLVH